MNVQKLQSILDKKVDQKTIFGNTFKIETSDFEWEGSSGNFKNDDCFFIASTTKLFTTALIYHYVDTGKLSLNTPILNFFDEELVKGLNVFKGKDYSKSITIQNLLAHTSGIPDYFQQKNQNGISIENELCQNIDRAWSFEEIIEISKTMKAPFANNSPNKAFYSDTNFQLLGRIIEKISGKSYNENLETLIFKPLNLKNTYLFNHLEHQNPIPLYFKKTVLNIPKAMSSFDSDGSIVSNTNDLMIFIQHFFKGQLFNPIHLKAMQEWNSIFFPMQSGVGIHRFKLPWFLSFGQVPEMIGHSGLSGTFAFFVPKKNMYIVGTVNQIAHPDQSFKTAIQLINQF